MKKQFLIFALAMGSVQVFAGGVITNTNQSTQFVRTVSRNASLDDDAVYFNPAATAQFSEGLHLSYSHQVCIQKRTTTDDFPTLNNHEYEGKVFLHFQIYMQRGRKITLRCFSASDLSAEVVAMNMKKVLLRLKDKFL